MNLCSQKRKRKNEGLSLSLSAFSLDLGLEKEMLVGVGFDWVCWDLGFSSALIGDHWWVRLGLIKSRFKERDVGGCWVRLGLLGSGLSLQLWSVIIDGFDWVWSMILAWGGFVGWGWIIGWSNRWSLLEVGLLGSTCLRWVCWICWVRLAWDVFFWVWDFLKFFLIYIYIYILGWLCCIFGLISYFGALRFDNFVRVWENGGFEIYDFVFELNFLGFCVFVS